MRAGTNGDILQSLMGSMQCIYRVSYPMLSYNPTPGHSPKAHPRLSSEVIALVGSIS